MLLANCDTKARENKHISISDFNPVKNRNSNDFFQHVFLRKSQ